MNLNFQVNSKTKNIKTIINILLISFLFLFILLCNEERSYNNINNFEKYSYEKKKIEKIFEKIDSKPYAYLTEKNGKYYFYDGTENKNKNLYKIDLQAINEEIENWHWQGRTLTKKDFRSLDLRGINFTESKLSFSDFRGANLQGTNFFKTSLSYTNFEGNNLSKINFKKAIIHMTNFYKVKLIESNLSFCHGTHIIFVDSDVSYANLKKTVGSGFFINSNFSYSNFEESSFKSSRILNCFFDCANLKNANFSYSSIKNSSFIGVNFSNANLTDIKAINCNFTAADLRGADLRGSIFINVVIDSIIIDLFTIGIENLYKGEHKKP